MEKSLTKVRGIMAWGKAHPKKASFVGVAVVLLSYALYAGLSTEETETRYVLGAVERGTLVTSISGTGQVSASTQIDLKPKASGDVVFVGVKSGDEVKAGTLIAQIDAREAQKLVRDAEVNFESAKLSLAKLQQPTDALSLVQSENSLARANESKQEAEQELLSAYENGFTAVSNAFLDLPNVMTGIQTVLFTPVSQLSQNEQPIEYYASAIEQYDARAKTFRDDVAAKYLTARALYDKNFISYKSTARTSSNETIAAMIDETYLTTKAMSDLLKSANNQIQFYKDVLSTKNLAVKSAADTQLTQINAYSSDINSHLSAVLSARTTIDNQKTTIVNAQRTITETTESLKKLKAGTDPLDLQSSILTLTQRENALRDARETLANYFVRAPFDGTVATLDVRKGDALTSGSIISTFITKEKIAEISLNEVDVAKVTVGQSATLTFDAVEGLTITGKVAEVDTVGTVSQGVVTYAVKISFDTDDERVRPGMSVSAAVITEVKQETLMVPNGAIKTQGDVTYIEVFDPPLNAEGGNQGVVSLAAPTRTVVTVGASNDISTEIVAGATEGMQVVTRTITGASPASQQAPSIFSAAGVRTPGGGGAVRGVAR